MTKEQFSDERWQAMLMGGEPYARHMFHILGLLPSSPRCKMCNAPFSGIGGTLMSVLGKPQSKLNPRYCDPCNIMKRPGGAEIEITMLFADARDSTTLAENMSAYEFSRLMKRFYTVATDALVKTDAIIDKLVGDEVIGLFVPGFAGKEHAKKAIDAAQRMLRATGHEGPGDPWLPVGVGVHTGVAFVGVVEGTEGTQEDFTALGDNVNITARLVSQAGTGEILISEAAYIAAGISNQGLEQRKLDLKGKSEPVNVRVLSMKEHL